MTQLDVGPIDYLALEFPGAKLNGEGFAALVDLTEQGIIRILDLVVAIVAEDGSFAVVAIADLDGDGELDLAVFEGVRSGLLDDDDIAQSAALVRPRQRGRPAALREHLGRPVRRPPCGTPAPRSSPAAGSRPTRSSPRSTRSSRPEATREGADMGLIGGMARTAVVAGTATAVSNRVSRRQAGPLADQQAQAEAYQEQQYQQPPPQQVVYAAPAAAPAAHELGRPDRAAPEARRAA